MRSRFKIHYSREDNHSLLTNSGVLQFSTTLNHISLGGIGGIESVISKPQNSKERVCGLKFSYIFFNFYFYFILLYNTVLVLPYMDMNPPRVYMRSQT